MAGTFLTGVPHTFEFSKAGDDHVCRVQVSMPDNSVEKFEATGATKQAASLTAKFKASFALKCARELAELPAPQEQEAPAPVRVAKESGDSSRKSLDVEPRDIEPNNVTPDRLADTPLDQYSSSAEEGEDEPRVGRRNAHHTPIAFIPGPDTAGHAKPVENEGCDTPTRNDIDEKCSLERSSLGDAESQHEKEVLDEAPSPDCSRESSDVDEGELVAPFAKSAGKHKVDRLGSTSQKRKGLARSEPACERDTSPQPGRVPATSKRRVTLCQSEFDSVSKKQRTQTGPSRKHRSNKFLTSNGSNLPSSMENGNNSEEEAVRTQGSTGFECGQCREYDKSRHRRRRKFHNAELPVTSGLYSQGSRIPRCSKNGHKTPEADLDITQSHEYDYPMYQPHPPPLGPMSQAPHPGQIHNTPLPFGGHPMFPGAMQHQMAYAPQYAGPPMPHPPGHIGASYPRPVAPYVTPPSGQAMAPTYIPQPGFPPMMPHTMGAFPYQQPLPNGSNSFYHSQSPAAYHGPQLHDNEKAHRDAEIRATATQVAAKMAAEAAAKDAARNAKSDFEADQKAKRASQCRRTTPGNSVNGGLESSSIALEPTREVVAAKEGSVQRSKFGENDISVNSIPADDGDQEDYVSTLNRMAQKGATCRNLSAPSYATVRVANRPGQQCTMSVTFVPGPEKEGILISRTVVASKKRKAKQLAAKEILTEITKRLESRAKRSDDEEESKEKKAKTAAQKKNNGITTAVAALHRLYTLKALCAPPCFKPEEPSTGADRGLWKSIVLLDVKEFGKRTYEAVGSSKKAAKQLCAFKAFEALKEMQIPEVESFTNVSKDGKAPENNKSPGEEVSTAIEAIVSMSDDDKDSNSSVDTELTKCDDQLVLPKDYKLVFPENELECEQWFKDNPESDAHFGLFVDSPRARAVFTTRPSQKVAEATKDFKLFQPRFLCLSTAMSGMVICFPELTEGPASESADDVKVSLPEVLIDALEDSRTKKHGFAVEDGMAVLEYEEDFRVQAVDDVSIISLAITGLETVKRSGPLASLPELTRLWLRRDVGQVSVRGAWRDKRDIPARLIAEGGKDIMIGVLASYACFCISQQMRQAARQKRTRMHGVAAAFVQLSEQLMSTISA